MKKLLAVFPSNRGSDAEDLRLKDIVAPRIVCQSSSSSDFGSSSSIGICV